MATPRPQGPLLPSSDAATYAKWFACLADPTRIRLLHVVAASSNGISVDDLTQLMGIGPSSCSDHVRKLAETGLVRVDKAGGSTVVTVNEACYTELPHPADAAMGILASAQCRPAEPRTDITVRALRADDWQAVRRIYAEGIATGVATFETAVPSRSSLDAHWLPDHRWVAEVDGRLAGWASAAPASSRECYSGVAETSVYVSDRHRGLGIGSALLHQQVAAADQTGLWTLQTAIFTANRRSLVIHHAAGFRTVGIRERIAQRDNTWHDTVLLERRAAGS
jgi:L-amino acid N-acyltransferase YncA